MANPNKEVIAFVGDGSYLLYNSDIYSSVITNNKLIIIVCDNGGHAVINRLQLYKGGKEFNCLPKSSKPQILFRLILPHMQKVWEQMVNKLIRYLNWRKLLKEQKNQRKHML